MKGCRRDGPPTTTPASQYISTLYFLVLAFVAAGSQCTPGQDGLCAAQTGDDYAEIPKIEIHSPQQGEEVVGGFVTVTWEVTYFDIVQGYVEVEVDDQVVNTPLPLEPISGQFLEPELTLDSRFGSNVPLEDGAHRIRAILYDLQGQEQAAAAVSVSVTRSPAFPPPNYTIDGNAQSWSTLLNQAVTNREPLRETFASFINAWPPPGHCGQDMRSVPGFPAPDAYRHRPLVVYVCPPDKCGGSLDWMRWQEEAAAACGARCLWLDRMACHHYADVVLLSCYAAPPIGFGKWPHQVWAYLCMEADTRRNLLSSNLLRHLDIVANYRLHADFPRLPPAAALQQASSSSSEPPWHVTVTYTPGNFDMYSAFEANAHAQRPHLAAYLVSNCGRPRDLYIARLLEVLGDRVHSLGRCFNNRPMPKASRHGSPTLALLRQYKFTIAIENYLAHDYVSERFYQPLLSGSVPVYLGAPNVAEFAPASNSFLDIRQYQSPEELAEVLLKLEGDGDAYGRLLEWRNGSLANSYRELMGASMTRSSVYGEGKHHGSQHEVDLRHLHATFCRRLLNVTQRRGLC